MLGVVAGYHVITPDTATFTPTSSGDPTRGIMRLSELLQSTRANAWRLPSGTSVRRHLEKVQEEIFVVLEGTATIRLGEPAEAIELPRGSIAIVEPGTPVQLRNDGEDEIVVLVVGAPPVEGQAEYLPE